MMYQLLDFTHVAPHALTAVVSLGKQSETSSSFESSSSQSKHSRLTWNKDLPWHLLVTTSGENLLLLCCAPFVSHSTSPCNGTGV